MPSSRVVDEIVLIMHSDDPHESKEGGPHPEPKFFRLSGLHLAGGERAVENCLRGVTRFYVSRARAVAVARTRVGCTANV